MENRHLSDPLTKIIAGMLRLSRQPRIYLSFFFLVFAVGMDFLHTPALLLLPYPRGISSCSEENRGKYYSRGRQHECDRGRSAGVNHAETFAVVWEIEGGAGGTNALLVLTQSEKQKSPRFLELSEIEPNFAVGDLAPAAEKLSHVQLWHQSDCGSGRLPSAFPRFFGRDREGFPAVLRGM